LNQQSTSPYMSTNSNATQAEHDRSDLLKEAVALTMAAAHGLQRLNQIITGRSSKEG
jgi:hypothetical protein